LTTGLEKRLANLIPMKPGQNRHTTRRDRIALRFGELCREYFPDGNVPVMAGTRLSLAAKHFIDAETCRDPYMAQRATRCAEYLLRKLAPPPTPAKPVPSLKDLGIG